MSAPASRSPIVIKLRPSATVLRYGHCRHCAAPRQFRLTARNGLGHTTWRCQVCGTPQVHQLAEPGQPFVCQER